MRSTDAVAGEIDLLYREYVVKTFKIIDEMFVLNDRHVNGVCEGLAAKPYAGELNIWAYARVETAKQGQLPLLRAVVLRWLALGIESGRAQACDGAEKSFDQDDIREIVHQFQTAGINVIGNCIFGMPDDNLVTMRQTLDLAKELNCELANFYSTTAYPGSPFYTMAVQNGWELPESRSGFSQLSYDCRPLPTEHVSVAEVLRFRDDAFHEYFANKRYLDIATQKYGVKTREHIEEMSEARLERAIY